MDGRKFARASSSLWQVGHWLAARRSILVDLPDGQTVRCRIVNIKDDGSIQVMPEITKW